MSIPMMAMTTRGVTTMAAILPGLSTSGQTSVGEKGIGGERRGKEEEREGEKETMKDWKTKGIKDQK